MKKLFFLICLALGIVISTLSCQNGNQQASQQASDSLTNNQPAYRLEFVKPFSNSNYKIKDIITIELVSASQTKFDSIQLKTENKLVATLPQAEFKFQWDTKNGSLGLQTIRAIGYINGSAIETTIAIVVLPAKAPKQYTYKIIKTYPHSSNAYTQGLIYENGYFYESDGEYKKSAIRKVKLETGESTILTNLEPTIFGEGLALYNNKLYQLSWKEHVGFIYNKQTLKLEQKFNFDLSEGWGLEFDGKNFLATDGSSYIYSLDPQSLTQVSKIQAVSNKGPIDNLNELELIGGKLYANIYYQDIVVIIDPKTGEITGEISFAGILPKADYNEDTNVLNGIAWNPANGHLFVTGKNWPKLFEVEIIEQRAKNKE
jgi:glutaminyl-peptide cyclotransferase